MESEKQKPNILFITTDQQHWNTIHALGNDAIQTPNLDRLVRDGVVFERTYAANPTCTPSRSSILTGKYASRHGAWNIGVALDQSHKTIGEVMSENNYQTGLFGKAHFQPVLKEGSFEGKPNIHNRDFWREWNGPYYGFEKVSLVHGHGDEDSAHGMHYGAWLEDHGIDVTQHFGPGGGHREGSWDLPEKYHYTRWTADETMSFIEDACNKKDNNRPFFAWCSFQDPHNAFLCPEPWNSMYNPDDLPAFHEREGEMADKPMIHQYLIEDRMVELDVKTTSDPGHDTGGIQCLGHTNKKLGYKRARQWLASYYAMISLVDHHVGRILDKLDEMGLSENTLVIFTSDHGDYAGNHGLWLKGPIHYDDVVRVPFLARWKGQLPSGIRSNSLVSLVDIAPTFMDMCGITREPTMQGVSQWETFKHPEKPSREWCLVENRAELDFYVKTVVMDRYKLNYFLNRDEGELYDLKEDPHEYVNLYNNPEYSDIRLHMFMKLVDIYGKLEEPYPSRESFA